MYTTLDLVGDEGILRTIKYGFVGVNVLFKEYVPIYDVLEFKTPDYKLSLVTSLPRVVVFVICSYIISNSSCSATSVE